MTDMDGGAAQAALCLLSVFLMCRGIDKRYFSGIMADSE